MFRAQESQNLFVALITINVIFLTFWLYFLLSGYKETLLHCKLGLRVLYNVLVKAKYATCV
jgi:hypothetical protein